MEESLMQEDRQSLKFTDGVKISCDTCGMVGGVDEVIHPLEDEEGKIEFLVLEMQECGHGYVAAVKDDRVQGALDELGRLKSRAAALQGSGDGSGLIRTLKKLQAKQIHVQTLMRNLWQRRAEEISEWPPTERLVE